jgi:hypothetical protein
MRPLASEAVLTLTTPPASIGEVRVGQGIRQCKAFHAFSVFRSGRREQNAPVSHIDPWFLSEKGVGAILAAKVETAAA